LVAGVGVARGDDDIGGLLFDPHECGAAPGEADRKRRWLWLLLLRSLGLLLGLLLLLYM
jgi:hypothetical protein